MREFIVGMGGQNLQKPAGPKPNSQVRNGTTYGVLKLALDTASYSWQFVPVAGQMFSNGGPSACHTHVAVASVTVSPSSATVQVGGPVQLTATPKDAAGNPLTDRTVTWTSSDTTIARVNGSGLVTGKANGGPITITATSEGKSGTSAITVTTVPVASVDVTPSTATIQVNATVQLVAAGKDANGNPVDGATVTRLSLTPAVANVSARGYVVGLTAATANLTTTSHRNSDTLVRTLHPSSRPPGLAGAGGQPALSTPHAEGTAPGPRWHVCPRGPLRR